ncbi:50S ribosomal protein L9 [Candidatus Protochlamydia amoebophila]|nr:50S ribosomal protein L9 [Candidatus Protochlamydia amoebophila]
MIRGDNSMAQLLLIKDVEALGRSGEIVNVKPGFARNFLLPQSLAVIADKNTLRMQERLKAEREKRAIADKKESEAVAMQIEGMTLVQVVKVDQEGHMYGSVTVAEIVHLIQDHAKIELEKKDIQLKHPIKTTGVHSLVVKLKEGVTANFNLKVMSEEGYRASLEEQKA